RSAARPRLQPRQPDEAGRRRAGGYRQHDRCDDRHRQAEGDLRQCRSRVVAGPVRQCAPSRRHQTQRHRRAGGRRAARPAGHLRLRHQAGPDGRDAADRGRSGAGWGRVDSRGAQAGRARRRRRPIPPAARQQGGAERARQLAFGRPRGACQAGNVSISQPFIERPIATSLLTLGILMLGILGYRSLPIAALPAVDFPTIQVSVALPGASPETLASSVTTPLEHALGQIAALNAMTSTSSFGNASITLQFELSRDIDSAAQDVQAAISASAGQLRKGLPNPPIYSKVNPADTPVIILAVTSDSLPLRRVNDFADNVLAQKLSQVEGVGLVTIEGGQKPAVRIQVNPTAVAALGLGLEDVRAAIGAANVDMPKGNLDGPRQSFAIGADDQILSADAYANIIIAYKNGSPVRLGDV